MKLSPGQNRDPLHNGVIYKAGINFLDIVTSRILTVRAPNMRIKEIGIIKCTVALEGQKISTVLCLKVDDFDRSRQRHDKSSTATVLGDADNVCCVIRPAEK